MRRRPRFLRPDSCVRALAFLLIAGCGSDSTGPVPAAQVLVAPDSITLLIGSSHQLSASVRDAKGAALTERTILWNTDNSTLASVSGTGLVMAHAAGRVLVSATSEGKSGQAVIRVEPVPVASLTIEPDSVSMVIGMTVSLSATARSATGGTLAGRDIEWMSSDLTKASVSGSGGVTAIAAGEVVIRAVSEGKIDSTVVTIGTRPDFAIVSAHITQGVQAADGSVPMILGGNPAVVNVVMRANSSFSQRMAVVLRIFNASGSLVRTDSVIRFAAPSRAHGFEAPDAQFLVPAAQLAPGHRWQVIRDPAGASPDESSANDAYPRSGTIELATVIVPPLDIRFVPIQLAAHAGETGNVQPWMLPEYLQLLRSVHPLGVINATIGSPFATNLSFGTPPSGGPSTFWTSLLAELDLARVASDAPNAHWYGVVLPPNAFTFTSFGGFAYIPASNVNPRRTALGVQIGWFADQAQARELVAHELGHNFGRRHAPCGNPGSPDANFPNVGGLIGLPQHDVFAWASGRRSFAQVMHASAGDIMGYCDQPWVSEYTYRGVLAFRAPVVAAAGAVARAPAAEGGEAGAMRQRVLVIRGAIEAGRGVTLSPTFVFDGHPSVPGGGGSYVLEGRSSGGATLFSYRFEPTELDHAPGVRQFAFAIPASSAIEASLAGVTVRGPAGSASLSAAPSAPQPAGAPAIQPQIVGGSPGYACADAGARGILVLDAVTGAVLAVGGGSSVRYTAPAGAQLAILCSDGVRTVRTTIAR